MVGRKFYKDKYCLTFIEKLHTKRGFKHVCCDSCLDVFKNDDDVLVIVYDAGDYYYVSELQMEV